MFDYMLRKLDNGRILVRNMKEKTNENIKASELTDYLKEAFADTIAKSSEEEIRIQELREEFAKKGLE